MDKTAVTTAIYALLAALGADTVPAAAAEAAPPAPKKAGKAQPAADKPAAGKKPATNLALTGEERKALRAEFRAKHGPEWFTDAAVKAEYDRRAWAKRTGAPAPAAEPKAPAAVAAEGGIDAMGLRALQALRKQMGLKGRLGESAEEVRGQIRGARAAAEPKTKPAAKPAAKGKGRREVC